ncbi:hypothetical protein KB236_04505 [Levilactobacillus brevis]|nr:hypothetical protein KB236_04505 [Levilactobacillus brevis]
MTPIVNSGISGQAASWHKGAPKIARGTWDDKAKYPKGAMYDTLHISKKVFIQNDNDPYLTHLKYKKVKAHFYKFKGYDREAGKTISTGTYHFISKHHVRITAHHHTMNLYK